MHNAGTLAWPRRVLGPMGCDCGPAASTLAAPGPSHTPPQELVWSAEIKANTRCESGTHAGGVLPAGGAQPCADQRQCVVCAAAGIAAVC